jgi:hypothetical protein
MTIHWVTAFIDVPADSFDDALRFLVCGDRDDTVGAPR